MPPLKNLRPGNGIIFASTQIDKMTSNLLSGREQRKLKVKVKATHRPYMEQLKQNLFPRFVKKIHQRSLPNQKEDKKMSTKKKEKLRKKKKLKKIAPQEG